MTAREESTWHRLTSWREDASFEVHCGVCGIPIRVGDTYRVAGCVMLCTLRPFCPTPLPRELARDTRRARLWKRRSRRVTVGRPRRVRPRKQRDWTLQVPRVLWVAIAVCRCGKVFRQQLFKGVPQQTCSRPCTARMLEERAAALRQRECAICTTPFVFRSEHPTQTTCSPSCGARLREQRKREASLKTRVAA